MVGLAVKPRHIGGERGEHFIAFTYAFRRVDELAVRVKVRDTQFTQALRQARVDKLRLRVIERDARLFLEKRRDLFEVPARKSILALDDGLRTSLRSW